MAYGKEHWFLVRRFTSSPCPSNYWQDAPLGCGPQVWMRSQNKTALALPAPKLRDPTLCVLLSKSYRPLCRLWLSHIDRSPHLFGTPSTACLQHFSPIPPFLPQHWESTGNPPARWWMRIKVPQAQMSPPSPPVKPSPPDNGALWPLVSSFHVSVSHLTEDLVSIYVPAHRRPRISVNISSFHWI